MKFLSMTREELVEYVKEINGLVGAVDGDSLRAIRRLVEEYNRVAWRLERCGDLIEFMLDKVPDDIRGVVEKEYKEVSSKMKPDEEETEDRVSEERCPICGEPFYEPGESLRIVPEARPSIVVIPGGPDGNPPALTVHVACLNRLVRRLIEAHREALRGG